MVKGEGKRTQDSPPAPTSPLPRKDTRKGDRHKPRAGDRHKPRAGDRHKTDAIGRRVRSDRNPMLDRKFVAWDGEGQGDRLVLLSNSEGDHLRSMSGISTAQAFDFLIKHSKREWANVWFGFSWDVNMMLRDLDWGALQELYDKAQVFWGGYFIQWIPKHLFLVKSPHGTFASYDTLAFFGTSFIGALELYNVKVPALIHEGKAARSVFDTWSVDAIQRYNDEECRLLVSLMDRLRYSIKEAGWNLRQWWGASALSAWFLGHHKADQYIIDEKGLPVREAYFGGHIEAAGWGWVQQAYHYDINSAYPAAMTHLPDLTQLQSYNGKEIEPFSLVLLSWKIPEKEWGPFPYREYTGQVFYPREGRGWYWGVEVLAAKARLGKRMRMKVEQIISFRGEWSYPLAEPITLAYRHRRILKKAGDPTEYPIKIGLNALYGKMAQKQGTAKYRSYLWAGYVTAYTRAMLQPHLNDDTLLTMTDSLFTKSPLKLSLSDDLGAWGGGETDRLSVIQAGYYEFGDDPYTRGFERDNSLPISEILRRFNRGEHDIPMSVTRFIGLGAALQGRRKDWCKWITSDRVLTSMGALDENMFTKRTSWPNLGFNKRERWHPLHPVTPPSALHGEISKPYDRESLWQRDAQLLMDHLEDSGDDDE